MESLRIEGFALGAWETNCYVAWTRDGGECLIIDAGYEPDPLLAFVERHDLAPTQVVLTHAHLDHIGGLQEIRQRFPAALIAIHEAEREFLTDTALNLSAFVGEPLVAPEATATFRHGDTVALGEHTFEIRHTPGHSPGNVCLYQPDAHVAIVGDTLFAGSIGRYDFPTSDGPTLMRSIREQLLTLPDNTRVLPGHGPETTIGRERRSNPYLR